MNREWHVVGVLLRLQWLVLWRGYTRSVGRLVAVLGSFFMYGSLAVITTLGAMTAARLWAQDPDPALHANLAVLVFSVWYVYMLAAPLVGHASSLLVDFSKLQVYPISPQALFVAGLVGTLFNPLFWIFLPQIVGATLVLSPALIVCRLLVLALFTVHYACVFQCLALLSLAILAQRRWKDLARIVGPLLAVALYVVLRLSLTRRGDQEPFAWLHETPPDFVWFLPPGWVAQLYLGDTGDRPIGSALTLACLLVATGLLYWSGWRLQQWTTTREMALASPVRTARRDRQRTTVSVDDGALVPTCAAPSETEISAPIHRRLGILEAVLPTGMYAVFCKELLILRREPLIKTLLLQQGGVWLVLIVVSRLGQSMTLDTHDSLFIAHALAFLLVYLALMLVLNLYGLEGRAIQMLLLSPLHRFHVVAGKALAYLVLFGGVLLVCELLLAVLFRSLTVVCAPLVSGLSLLILALGAGSVVSALLGQPLRVHGKSPLAYSRNEQQGCLAQMLLLFSVIAVFLLAAPILIAVFGLWLRFGPWTWAFTLPFSLLYAITLGGFGLYWGARLLPAREYALYERFCRADE